MDPRVHARLVDILAGLLVRAPNLPLPPAPAPFAGPVATIALRCNRDCVRGSAIGGAGVAKDWSNTFDPELRGRTLALNTCCSFEMTRTSKKS